MKELTLLLCLASIVVGLTVAVAKPELPTALASDASFGEFFPKFTAGIDAFLNGDRHAWKANAS